MDERITAIRQHTSIMENLRLPKEVIEYVNSIEEGSVSEWIYLCAVDGIPLKALEKIGAAKAGDVYKKVSFIRGERQKYLKRIYGDSELGKGIEETFRQVRLMSEENRKLRGLVEEKLKQAEQLEEDVHESKKRAYELEIKNKDKMLRERDARIQDLERELQSLMDEGRATLPEREEQEKAGKTGKSCTDKKGHGWLWRIFRNRDSRVFIETYLKDESYTGEQREYLLKCFEDGIPLKEISRFASPGMPVDIMERLKKNLEKER